MRLAATAVLLLALTACTGDEKAQPLPTPTPTPEITCPPPGPASGVWPPEVPDDLPKPPGARIEKAEKAQGGVTVVYFSTHNSLRDGVLHVVREFPKHGYTIGRGDAEVSEADAPFHRGDIQGLVRMLAREACKTQWLLAISRASGLNAVPFAPNYTPPPSAAPLPFG
jgi:hypothetical protein